MSEESIKSWRRNMRAVGFTGNMRIITRGAAFDAIYEDLKSVRGDMTHARLTHETARRIIARRGRGLGHIVLIQGDSFECSRCGASCSLLEDLTVAGNLVKEPCPL